MTSIKHFQCSSRRFQSDSSLVYRLHTLCKGLILLVGFTVFVLILWVRERDRSSLNCFYFESVSAGKKNHFNKHQPKSFIIIVAFPSLFLH